MKAAKVIAACVFAVLGVILVSAAVSAFASHDMLEALTYAVGTFWVCRAAGGLVCGDKAE